MKKYYPQSIYIVFAIVFFACSPQKEQSEEDTQKNTLQEAEKPEEPIPDYQEMIQGFWEIAEGDDYAKVQYQGNQVFSPEAETEVKFEIDKNIITYSNKHGAYKTRILEMTQDKFVEEAEDRSSQNVWVRPQEEVLNLDGEWEFNDQEGFPLGYMKFAGSRVDMAQMGIYEYHIEGDSIKFKNVERGVDFARKVVKISKTTLILESGGVQEIYQKK